ncbi:MAG: hypothetical protein BIFFINMI_01016 [Phycisphaerae bacterium]|nr:hypothetical protein [Phycisphaerae bacterium]
MSEQIVAVPSASPGGLESIRSLHFGHAPCFTVVTLKEGQPEMRDVVDNGGHATGGCMASVQALRAAGVGMLLVGGLGQRPLDALTGAGIEVRFCNGQTVADVIDAHLAGESVVVGLEHLCNHNHGQGHTHGHGHEHGHTHRHGAGH